MSSTVTQPELIAAAGSAGVHECLMKPFLVGEVKALVERALTA